MFTIHVDVAVANRDALMARLADRGIETRPVFYPLPTLPPYRMSGDPCPVAEQVARRGINLPTWGGLTRDDIGYVSSCLRDSLGR
jgi:perosamine synthetase